MSASGKIVAHKSARKPHLAISRIGKPWLTVRASALLAVSCLILVAPLERALSNTPVPQGNLPPGGRSMAPAPTAPSVVVPVAPPIAPANTPTPPLAQPPALQQPPSGWSQIEIDQARARCTAVLRGIDLVAIPQTPLKDGPECGAPAPVELVSLGKNPQVTFSPPVIVTCDMAVALNNWISRDLQPLARKHLGGPIVQVATMSSYSCRNAYGRKASRLSEHGRANALDIRHFLTANAHSASVLADWGPTGRDIRAQVAAARAAAQKAEAAKAAATAIAAKKGDPGATNMASQTVPPTGSSGTAGATIAAPPPTIGVGTPSGGAIDLALPNPSPATTGLGLSNGQTSPQRLGGPKAAGATPPPPVVRKPDLNNPAEAALNRTQFLRGAHETGCRIFGTILGPEANEAHRNHFHVDLAERRTTNFCE